MVNVPTSTGIDSIAMVNVPTSTGIDSNASSAPNEVENKYHKRD